MFFRKGLNFSSFKSEIFLFLKKTLPSEDTSFIRAWAIELFPDPLSPTIPKVSPLMI